MCLNYILLREVVGLHVLPRICGGIGMRARFAVSRFSFPLLVEDPNAGPVMAPGVRVA